MCTSTHPAVELLRNILHVHIFLNSFPVDAFYPNPAKVRWQVRLFLSVDTSTGKAAAEAYVVSRTSLGP